MAEPTVRHLPTIPPFDVDLNRATAGHRFEEWCELVDLHILALGVNNDERKKAIMLSIGGLPLISLTKSVDITPRPAVAADNNAVPPVRAQPAETVYEALKRALKAHFNPQHNIELNKLQFSECCQTKNETLDQFCVRLRKLSVGCNFADVDSTIKSQLLKGMRDPKLKATGYEKPNLTLQQILEKGRAAEAAQLHLKHLGQLNSDHSSSGAVNRVRGEKWFNKQSNQGQPGSSNSSHRGKGKKNHSHSGSQHHQSNKNHQSSSQSGRGGRYQAPHQQNATRNNNRRNCPFCGNQFHEDGLQACPAKGYQCYHCNNWDHFAHMCQIKSHQQSRHGSSGRGRGSGRKGSSRGGRANVIQDDDDDGSSDEESNQAFLESRTCSLTRLFEVAEQDDGSSDEDGAVEAAAVTRIEKPSVQLCLLGKKIRFLLDTGASNTITNQTVYRQLQRPPLRQTSKRIFPYKQPDPLELSGRFSDYLAIPGSSHRVKEKIYVLAEDGDEVCILSCSASKKLDLISFSKDVQVNLLSQELKNGKLPPIGRMKGVKVHLYVDPSVPPVAVPYRPKNLHDQELEIQEVRALDELDLIETVSGPTPFVSNSVIAYKPGGFRYCQDYRNLNRALLRTYHHLPTVESILLFAAGYQYFSVIDLNSSYHQLELDEQSRQFTTFNTPLGLRRYKVVPYGLSVAPEIFHNVIREAFQHLKDVFTAMDDLLVRGRTKEEHDRNLQKARQRLIELNLTSKEEKDQICQRQVRFWGIILTGDGVQMDPRKVKAINNCARPENVAALKSFLGMINYCSRFVKGHADVTAPLRELATKTDAEFAWSRECERAYKALKQQLTSEKTLAYFDVNKRTELMVDASPIGLGATLSQTDHVGKSAVRLSKSAGGLRQQGAVFCRTKLRSNRAGNVGCCLGMS